jgi:hypothetical protein
MSTHKLIIQRKSKDAVQTHGAIYVFVEGVMAYECKALELPDRGNQPKVSRVLAGSYKGRKCLGSPNIKYVHIDIIGTPGRTGIKIHKGNYIDTKKVDSLGCVLCGTSYGDINGDGHSEILNSGAALERLLQILPDDFDIEIRDEI